jgi:hypothetical protein
VSTIGKRGEANLAGLESVNVPLRIIVRGDDDAFGLEVTRTNNRQNRIENRDFVALDPEQARLRNELAIDGIDYQVMRNELAQRGQTGFDLVEATTALACASSEVRLAVQLKREIDKLWEDISKAPYKELFNPSVPGLHVWRCVQIQRRVDAALESAHKRTQQWKDYSTQTHRNRLISLLVFDAMPVAALKKPAFDIEQHASEDRVTALVDERVTLLTKLLGQHYPNAIIPTLFKNLKKCEHLTKEARASLAPTG